jgi:hypothetical protein
MVCLNSHVWVAVKSQLKIALLCVDLGLSVSSNFSKPSKKKVIIVVSYVIHESLIQLGRKL